jgi:hypothetical protein
MGIKPFWGVEFAGRGGGLFGLKRDWGDRKGTKERVLRTVGRGFDSQVP